MFEENNARGFFGIFDDLGNRVWLTTLVDVKSTDEFILALGDDGNLSVFTSHEPDAKHQVLDIGCVEHFEEICEITKIEYHLDRAKVTPTGSIDLYRQQIENHGDIVQKTTIDSSQSVNHTRC